MSLKYRHLLHDFERSGVAVFCFIVLTLNVNAILVNLREVSGWSLEMMWAEPGDNAI